MLRVLYRTFLVALAVLTRLPVPPVSDFTSEEKGRGLIWFPILGILMGAVLAATAWKLQDIEPVLASVVLLTAWLFVSELRHLDALASSINHWLFGASCSMREGQAGTGSAGQPPESPSHLGMMGVIALIMMMKFSALSVLIEYQRWEDILFAPVMARLLVVALIGFTRAAPSEPLAHEFSIEFPYVSLFIWLLMAIPLALVVGIPMFAVFAALLLIRFRMLQCSGGLTWEAIGASIVLLETAGLFAAALMA